MTGQDNGSRTPSQWRDLNTPHLFTPPASRQAWEARKAELRQQILFSAGLWPMPEKGKLSPRVTGRVEGPDYTIENVALETWPGFYLCGNLYRPKEQTGPFPAIVNPHGHWKNGRLEMEEDVPIAKPPPEPPAPGKGNLVAIGVNLARQGFVVFAYDMVGYNDTRQVSHQFANDLQSWLNGVSLLGLQLWNSIRVVDYLESLPEVDRLRIGATGASGGGTQVFLLCAVDDRIRVAVPVNMISATMQGGCLCENGPGLRIGTDNVEIGAMMAPKPLLLVSCTGDWTKENPEVEWPAIRKVYELYDAADQTAVRRFNYEHNYNIESREAMYAWFNRWLRNDSRHDACRERPFTLDPASLRVWSDAQPMPKDALAEADLIRSFIDASERQLAALWPTDRASWERFREVMAPALRYSLGVAVPGTISDRRSPTGLSRDGATGRRGDGAIGVWRQALIVVGENDTNSVDSERIRARLEARGYRVALAALPNASLPHEKLWDRFFSCYNRTPLGALVQTVLDALARLQSEQNGPIDLLGVNSGGPFALLARALLPLGGRTVIDLPHWDWSEDPSRPGAFYAPGLRRAGDLRTATMLAADGPLYLYDSGSEFPPAAGTGAFPAMGVPLRVETGRPSEDEIVAWLCDT
jgi:hypothetical protein